MTDGSQTLVNLMRTFVSQLLRVVPGSSALRLKRDFRDAAWLSQANAVIVSFPKSGRTFVRAMVARLYQRRFGLDERRLLEFPMLRQIPRDAPRVLFTHAGDAMRRPHEIRVDPAHYAGKRVVLIARHPGDIAVSRYHHLKHRSRDKARRRLAEQPLETFLWSEQGGIASIVRFLNAFAALPGVTLIRYEDFLAAPEGSLRMLSDAIQLGAADDEIVDAVQFGALDNLKKLEGEGYFTSSRLQRAQKDDVKSAKVRTGKSGGYRVALDREEVERIDAYIRDNLDPRFGYSAERGARP